MLRLAILACLVAMLPAPAALAVAPRDLSAAERDLVERASAFLNDLDTLEARFVQVSSTGKVAEGRLYMDRPGRMRIDYEPPSEVLIVARNGDLIYYDGELEQISHVDTDSTPAGLILRENADLLDPALMVTDVRRGPGVLEIAVRQKKDPDAGELVLVFSDRPFMLQQWRVLDPQGVETRISLYNIDLGRSLDEDLFEFDDPRPASSPLDRLRDRRDR